MTPTRETQEELEDILVELEGYGDLDPDTDWVSDLLAIAYDRTGQPLESIKGRKLA